jgi:Spy/CpxP family protein refolding chaperone
MMNKVTLTAIAAMTVALTFAVVPALTSAAFADPKGEADVECTTPNGANTPPGQQPSCQNETLVQETCVATTGNGKCPPGQNP